MRVKVDVRLPRDRLVAALAADVWRGLTSRPKELPPKWFYRPSNAMVDTQEPLLASCASEIAALSAADTLVEVDSWSAGAIVDAMAAGGRLMRAAFVGLQEDPLRAAGTALAAAHPGVQVDVVIADYERELADLAAAGEGTRMVALLGGRLGLLPAAARGRVLALVARGMRAGETLLLGVELITDEARMLARARPGLERLLVVNAELGADFTPGRFDAVPVWDAPAQAVTVELRAKEAHTVHLRAVGVDAAFEAGEPLRAETVARFDENALAAELGAAGFTTLGAWSDAERTTHYALARRA